MTLDSASLIEEEMLKVIGAYERLLFEEQVA